MRSLNSATSASMSASSKKTDGAKGEKGMGLSRLNRPVSAYSSALIGVAVDRYQRPNAYSWACDGMGVARVGPLRYFDQIEIGSRFFDPVFRRPGGIFIAAYGASHPGAAGQTCQQNGQKDLSFLLFCCLFAGSFLAVCCQFSSGFLAALGPGAMASLGAA